MEPTEDERTYSELQARAKELGLTATGTKGELGERVRDAEADLAADAGGPDPDDDREPDAPPDEPAADAPAPPQPPKVVGHKDVPIRDHGREKVVQVPIYG